ncbi:MAG: caspase family protein, partial [Bacteroidota bacterium]
MNKLFALLVGINDYQAPVSKLKGCIKDINNVEDYLKDVHVNDFKLHIKKLQNQEATYQNIINE